MASSSIYRKHNTTRRNQPCTKQRSKHVPTKSDNASKQTELTRASMLSSIYTTRCVLNTSDEIEICPAKV